MARHYQLSTLRAIGNQCSNRLPPASAVQAMFLYEMQRETEAEKLFQDQLFSLAKAEDLTSSLKASLASLECDVAQLRGQITVKDMKARRSCVAKTEALQAQAKKQDERLSTYEERLSIQEQKDHVEGLKKLTEPIASCTKTLVTEVNGHTKYLESTSKREKKIANVLDSHSKQLASHSEHLDTHSKTIQGLTAQCHGFDAKISTHSQALKDPTAQSRTLDLVKDRNENTTSIQSQLTTADQKIDSLNSLITTADADISVLFDERDALAAQLMQTNERISKLEDLVRALTLQKAKDSPCSNGSSNGSSPLLTQRIPVQTRDGSTMELCVPKGMPHVPLAPHQRNGGT